MKITTVKLTNGQKNIVFLVLYFLLFIFLIWRVRYGFAQADEAFYLGFPYRFFQGDAIIVQDWHLCQPFGFFLIPIVRLFFFINGSAEGILLSFRYIFLFVHALSTLYIYTRLKKINWAGSVISSIVFFLYVPFNISALSYNTLGIICLSLTCVTITTADKNLYLQMLFSGILFAVAFFCNPYLAVLYILYLIKCIVETIKHKNSVSENNVFSWKSFLCLTLGAVCIGIIFCIYIFSKTNINDILFSLKYILNAGGHPPLKYGPFINYLASVAIHGSKLSIVSIAVYASFFLLFIVELSDKSRTKHWNLYMGISVGLAFLMLIVNYFADHYINHLMFPINMIIFFLCASRILSNTSKNIVQNIWLPGMIYSFCINMSSNNHFYAISSASTVAVIGTIMIICTTISENYKNNFSKILFYEFSLFICCQIIFLFSLRYTQVYWDTGIKDQKHLISSGPEKGIIASEFLKARYEHLLVEANEILSDSDPAKNVIYDEAWLYLCDKKGCGAYSTFMTEGMEEDRLGAYYSLNPSKIPDYVLINKNSDFPVQWFLKTYGYDQEITSDCIILTKTD